MVRACNGPGPRCHALRGFGAVRFLYPEAGVLNALPPEALARMTSTERFVRIGVSSSTQEMLLILARIHLLERKRTRDTEEARGCDREEERRGKRGRGEEGGREERGTE